MDEKDMRRSLVDAERHALDGEHYLAIVTLTVVLREVLSLVAEVERLRGLIARHDDLIRGTYDCAPLGTVAEGGE